MGNADANEPPADPRPAAPARHRTNRIWDRFLDGLAQVEVGRPADQVLRKLEARAKDLGRSERRALREGFFGFLRTRRSVVDQLERAMQAERRPLDTLSVPARQELELLAFLAGTGAELPPSQIAKRHAKVLDRIRAGRLPKPKGSQLHRAAIEANVPDWLFERWEADRGWERARALGGILRERAPVTLFVRGDRDEAVAALENAAPTRWSPAGLTLPPGTPLSTLGDWVERSHLQDEGSQLLAWAAAHPTAGPPPRRILDACTGAGGKILALAHWSDAELHGVEPEASRLGEAKRRVKQAELQRAVAWHPTTLEQHAQDHPGAYDVVLVDAPCTGTGTLRRHPELAARLTKGDLEQATATQKRLLAAALGALAPHGTLLYATCSVLHRENEAVAAYLLAHAPQLRPVPVFSHDAPELRGCAVRIGPGPDPRGPDGFFVAAFRRGG